MLPANMLEGLPPNNAAYLMRLRCPDAATARQVADVIVESFDPARDGGQRLRGGGRPA